MFFPTAEELGLWDYEVEDGKALSVWPPAQEYVKDPKWYDQAGRDPLDQKFILRKESGEERTEKLRQIVEKYPRYGPKMYEKCAKAGRADIIRELLSLSAIMDIEAVKKKTRKSRGDDNEVPSVHMGPAILEAAYHGHLDCVKVLVDEAGIQPGTRYSDGATAVSNAAVRGHLNIVEWLLEHGAEITFKNRHGLDDFEAAIRSGNLNTLKLFLNSRQNQTKKYKIKPDAIIHATKSGNLDMLQTVLAMAHYPPAPWSRSEDAIHLDLPRLARAQRKNLLKSLPIATEEGNIDMVKLILSYLTPRLPDRSFRYFQLQDDDQKRVFHATEDAMTGANDNAELFEFVWDTILCPPKDELEKGSHKQRELWLERLNRRLISASVNGCPEIVKLLCEKYGADINHVSHKYFTTPLGRTAGSGDDSLSGRMAVAMYLLGRPGIDIHLACGEYSNGPTALALACREGQSLTEIAKLMLEHGGPVETIDASLSEVASKAGEDENVSIWLVMAREPRFPVRLLSKESFDEAKSRDSSLAQIELSVDGANLKRIVSNLQLRKSNSALAASDSKRRPLDLAKTKNGKDHMWTATRMQHRETYFGE